MRKRPVAADSVAAHADDLFRSRLENQIDLRHPLAQRAQRMPWDALDDALTPTLPPDPAAGGRPSLPVRLMAGLLYLKHAYDLSDEDACVRWLVFFGLLSGIARWRYLTSSRQSLRQWLAERGFFRGDY